MPGPDRQAYLQVLVGGLVVERDPLMHEVVVGRGDAAARQGVADLPLERPAHREALDQRVVDAQLDVVLALRDAAPDRPADVAPLQPNPEDVVAVERERVAGGQATVRGERQVLAHPGFLPRRVRQRVRLDDRAILERADGQTADLRGRGDVAVHQRGGHRQHLGVVVEAEARHVAREQGLAVDLQVQEVAHGVDVLGPVQAVRDHAPRVGRRGAHAVELRLERRHEGVDHRGLGPRASRGRHQPAAELAGHLLEELAVHVRPIDVDPVEHHPGRLQPLVVAGHAVAVEERARGPLRPARRRPRSGGHLLRRGRRPPHRCRGHAREAHRAEHSQREHDSGALVFLSRRLAVSPSYRRAHAAPHPAYLPPLPPARKEVA